MKKIRQYFSGIWGELKKVSWPSRRVVINHTAVVLASSLIAMGIVAAVDYGLTQAVEYFVSLK